MSQDKNLTVRTRPEIRKGCLWEIGMIFSKDFLFQHNIKDLYFEKPRVHKEGSAYLCLKVRSKILEKEIGFNKVAEVEKNISNIGINDAGVATLKVKFTQRPRAVFHKHSDVMILVVSVRSCMTNEVLTMDEHELIFRGGTGSVHSADSRKRQFVTPTDVESGNSSDSESTTVTPLPPNKKVLTEDILKFDMQLGSGYSDFNDQYDYYGVSNELTESLELEEWAKQYGIDTPLLDTTSKYTSLQPTHSNMRSLESSLSSTEQYSAMPASTDYEQALRKLKEEIHYMVNQKIEEFASTMYEKMEKQRKELESQFMYSTVLLPQNKMGEHPKKFLHTQK